MRLRLDYQQQERLNELLWDRGVCCPRCHTTNVASNGWYYAKPGDERISVRYVCWNRVGTEPQHPRGYGPFSITLEPHEARRIGTG